ncbi:uncharacterized protein LOC143023882 [Oratosquilla oratoria]|uniref:uncharacterized protein LOC143023882 n=1 Tax=Oratosquilla oratoria TaxID=337810 RepID=UPI003F75E4F7
MFVANRVTEIQTLTSPSNWFHCPGTDNPADMMTRGLLADQLISNNMWLGGPNWLSSSSCFHAGANIEDETHILAHTCEESMGEGTALTVNERATSVFGFSRYSEFSKVMNIVAWVKRFIINCKPDGTKHSGPLTYEELIKAKDILICVQKFQHNLLKHAGVHTLMSTIRNSYWIIGLRQVAKRVCRECVACKRFDSSQCSQSALPLPELRHYAVVYSDNAKTFKSVAKALQQYFSVFSPEWKFISPRSPWSALKKCLGTRCLTKCELETTLFEVEACINSRPLTYNLMLRVTKSAVAGSQHTQQVADHHARCSASSLKYGSKNIEAQAPAAELVQHSEDIDTEEGHDHNWWPSVPKSQWTPT